LFPFTVKSKGIGSNALVPLFNIYRLAAFNLFAGLHAYQVYTAADRSAACRDAVPGNPVFAGAMFHVNQGLYQFATDVIHCNCYLRRFEQCIVQMRYSVEGIGIVLRQGESCRRCIPDFSFFRSFFRCIPARL